MKPKLFDIIPISDKEDRAIQCSEFYLSKYIDEFVKENVSIILIKEINSKKEIDMNKQEKRKYYNSQYSLFYKYYVSGKITESKFMDIKNKLKDLKQHFITKEEFKNKFEEFNFLDNIKKNKFIYNT